MRFISVLFSFFVLIFLSISLVNATEQGHKADMRCEICGMGIMKGGKGNFVIELKDGSTRITDSPDCGILLRGNLADNVKAIKATDYDKKELINADSAYYVKGADITTKKDRLEKGLMPNSMVAFSTKEAAEAFQKEHGGSVLNYEEAVKSLAGKKMKKQGYDKDKGHGM